MPTFTLIEDGEKFRPELVREPGGYRGARHGWIDTGDITDALLNAANLPAYGSSWDALMPNLKVVRQQVMIWSGEVSLARLDYATPGLGGGTFNYPAAIGQPVTLIVPTASTVTAKRFIDATPGEPPIAQGQGVPREVGELDHRVKVAYHLSNLAAVPWARIRSLHTNNAINDEAVSLPNVFGSGYAKSAPAGTLRYRYAEFETDGDLFVVTHVMAEAEDHMASYEALDEDGNPVAIVFGHIYPQDTFAGLW